MLSSAIPTKFQIPFASGASPGFISQPLPVGSQAGGRASLTDGFSQLNFDPLASGGIPPWGKDFNGLMYMVTAWLQWQTAGGLPVGYDATFSAAIGGYPAGAFLKRAGFTGDRFWISSVENNITNPDTGGAGWIAFPDTIVQQQFGNAAIDTGTPNNYTIALSPVPLSLSALLLSPIRFVVGGTSGSNTIVNPVIHINGLSALTMINSNGTALLVNQISRSGQIVEGYYDGTFFQVTTPTPITGNAPAPSSAITGVIYEWPAETPPSWGLECNGARYNISSYPNLFNIIGNRFNAAGSPAGDGITTFNVPDKRGAFTRGWDHGRGLDPNATTRTNKLGGTIVGDHVASWELSAVKGTDLNGATFSLLGTPTGDGFSRNPLQQFIGSNDPDSGSSQVNLSTVAPAGVPSGINYGQQDSGQGNQTPFCYGIIGQANFSGGAAETRPVNIDMMYVIAF